MLEMDDLDKRLLNHIQGEFPMNTRPYAALGEALEVSEDEIIARMRRLKEAEVIRQVSAIFDTRTLGYQSSLVAMKVAPERLNAAAQVVNLHPGVSHNYKRNHAYNMWFTIALPKRSDLQGTLDRLHELTGAESTRYLPTLRLYKIGVRMDMTGDEGLMSAEGGILPKYTQEDRNRAMLYHINQDDVQVIRALQEDLAIEPEPFAAPAAGIGLTQEQLLAHGKHLNEVGILRRFAAILFHRKAGFAANAMGVWIVPEDRLHETGEFMARFNAV
ncbi:MAG: AsnC family transcriptional regulator, partial [Chloroflexi bacterium]|nr:AsnC family transcriptional regulator [Chloroflexota bacterium]